MISTNRLSAFDRLVQHDRNVSRQLVTHARHPHGRVGLAETRQDCDEHVHKAEHAIVGQPAGQRGSHGRACDLVASQRLRQAELEQDIAVFVQSGADHTVFGQVDGQVQM